MGKFYDQVIYEIFAYIPYCALGSCSRVFGMACLRRLGLQTQPGLLKTKDVVQL